MFELSNFKKKNSHSNIFHFGVKTWLGYPKKLSHFIFTGPPHLNMLLKLNNKFILKV
jgi:hypothetical protein